MALPIFHTDDKDFQLMQSSWSSQINPVLARPSINSSILKNVLLVTGSNTINHLLQKPLQGWKIVRQRALASIYDNQDSNPQPSLTLVLISSANVSCDIEVF